jgi:hypothetical protein
LHVFHPEKLSRSIDSHHQHREEHVLMALTLRLLLLASLTSALSLAESWSGLLVDSRCYTSSQNNMKAGSHPASTDIGRTLRVCAATARTRAFAIVQHDGTSVGLDADGNQKAHELVMKRGKMSQYEVNVTGDMIQNTLKVATIWTAK